MKPTEFKKLIKEAVREAIQEELEDILLLKEAAKVAKPIVTESKDTYAQPHIESPKQMNAQERRAMFSDMIEGMQKRPANTTYTGPFTPGANTDVINGSLPEGQVSLNQIMGLMSK